MRDEGVEEDGRGWGLEEGEEGIILDFVDFVD